jgi:hemerythrin-like domain-containing protein
MKATESLLADHKMIRKLLAAVQPDNPRLPEIMSTLTRVVKGHAWFEDEIFMPAFRAEPLLEKRYLDELGQEHKDIDHFMALVSQSPLGSREYECYALQLKVLLATHFAKEEDALFPLAERILDSEGLNRLAEEMRKRKGGSHGSEEEVSSSR